MRKESKDVGDQPSPERRKTRCVDPAEGVSLYDYYNGALEPDDVRRFERHLTGCAYCESVISQLDRMMGMLGENHEADSRRENLTDDPGTRVKLGA